MSKSIKLVMTALTAALVLSIAGGIASARVRVEVDQTRITATASRLSFTGGELPSVVCDVTLAGTLRRLIAKTRGAEAGTIEADTVTNCSVFGGSANANGLTEVGLGGPFRVQYGSITGTLPTITGGLLLVVGGFLIDARTIIGDARCLYRGTIGAGSEANPVRTLRVLREAIPLSVDLRGSIRCPATGSLSGSFTLAPAVTIRLLER